MARSDLLVSLVKAGTLGDRRGFRAAAEAIIAEERAKHHNILADQLIRAVQLPAGNGSANPSIGLLHDGSARHRDYVSEVHPRRRIEELILPTGIRRAVDELVEEQRRADLLRANGLEPRHRVLLAGPPGTGKTTLAEAIAEAAAVPMFVVRYESIIGSYLGETASRLKRVFDYAKTTPCVLFFDEFDAIGKERGDVHETGEIKRVVSSLLMQVDELPSYTIIIAASNHPELLDRASWRRFQLRLRLPMPTTTELAQYISSFSERFRSEIGYPASVIAKQLAPISYAEIEEFCLDLQRRLVLSAGEISLKTIVRDQLDIWRERAQSRAPSTGDGTNRGRTSASTPPRT